MVLETSAPPMPSSDAATVQGSGADAFGVSVQESKTASLLGINDSELDDLKDKAKPVEKTRAQKRVKLSHDHFFKNENGFDKMVKTFHRIKFRGKGHEFDDLKVLLQSYDKWQQDLYPAGESLEDFALAARELLNEKLRDPEGNFSEPHLKLHESRIQYKKWEKGQRPVVLSDEMRQRIEANRQKALELQRKKTQAGEDADAAAVAEMEEAAAAATSAPRKAPPVVRPGAFDDEDDPFGFGGGMDDDDGFGAPRPPAPQAAAARPAVAHAAAMDEEEDPFGFGGGMDDDDGFGAPRPPAPQAAAARPAVAHAAAMDEEEDPFGFGGGMDDDDGFGAAPPTAPPASVAQPATAPAAAFDDEEDAFGLGGGMDGDDGFSAPPPQAAAAPTKPVAVPTPVRATCFDEEEDLFGQGGFDMDEA